VLAVSCLSLVLFVSLVSGATIRVPRDQPTIQAGIDAAVDGDTVLVASGSYYENINFIGKGIVLISMEGPDSTIIDGENWMIDEVVCMASTENDSTVFSGFTVRNGRWGIYLISVQGAPLITDNIITDNEYAIISLNIDYSMSPRICNNRIIANSGGCAIYSDFASPLISDNIISNNTTASVVEFYYQFNEKTGSTWKSEECRGYKKAYLINNLIIENEHSVISVINAGIGRQVYFANNLIIRNGGDCFSLNGTDGIFCLNNSIVGNEGSGIIDWGSDLTIKNNIVCSNAEYGIWGAEGHNHNNVWNNALGDYRSCSPGPGDISEDPLFKDPLLDDFHLMTGSPCIDAGALTIIGFDMDMDHRPSGDSFDIGADEWVSPLDPHYRWLPLE